MKTITKIFIATFICLLGVLGLLGGVYLNQLETSDKNIELCALYMILQGFIIIMVCVTYNFITLWEEDELWGKDKPKAETPNRDNLDNLEEVPVEEVN